jgi:hypothetical protein
LPNFGRPDSILTVKYGRLPRQSYPPQTGVFKLPVDDPLTKYLTYVASQQAWDEWDYCWSRLKYLPRWDMKCIWDGPPGWITPHAFLAWGAWHMTVAHGWLARLYRSMRRSHSPEELLTSTAVVNPIYLFLDKGQVERARKDTYRAMKALHVGPKLYLPTPEIVTYPPDGLLNFMQFIKADHHLEESATNFEWHESRARHKAEHFVGEVLPTLRVSAVILNRHLGESAWSE